MDFTNIFLELVIVIIILILRGFFTNWLAAKLKWESSFRKGFLANLTWFLLLVIVHLIIIFYGAPIMISFALDADFVFFVFNFVVLLINLIIGIFTIKYFYNREYWGSSVITIIIVIIERIIVILINTIIYLTCGIFLTGGFYIFPPF